MAVVQLHAEHGVGESLDYSAVLFYEILVSYNLVLSLTFYKVKSRKNIGFSVPDGDRELEMG